jgi:NADH:ubiquinone reductase (H+-translocating)
VEADDKVGIRIGYDYLILAIGATHSYFGHDEFAAFAPELKSLSDADLSETIYWKSLRKLR